MGLDFGILEEMDAHFDKERSLLTPVEPRPAVSRRRLMPLLVIAFSAIVVYGALHYRGAQQLRTARVLTDVRSIESAFHAVFRANASFVINGCGAGSSVAVCDVFGSRAAGDVLQESPQSYVLAEAPTATSFSVRFSLPQRVGGFAKGMHLMNEQGIQ